MDGVDFYPLAFSWLQHSMHLFEERQFKEAMDIGKDINKRNVTNPLAKHLLSTGKQVVIPSAGGVSTLSIFDIADDVLSK